MAGNKSTNIELTKRISELVPLISILNRHEIQQYVAESTDWEISERQIDDYIAKARVIVDEQFKDTNKKAVENGYNNLINLYKKSFQDQDYKTCLAIQKEINEVYGIKVQKVDLSLKDFNITIKKKDE